MKTIITGRHLDMGDSLKEHIETSVNNMVDRYFGDVVEVHVNIDKVNHHFEAELSFHVSKHFIVHTRAEDTDPYRCFNLAMEKMEKRTQKYRSRLRATKRHDVAVEKEVSALTFILNNDTPDLGTDDNPVIIAEMNSVVPTVSVSDAVMHLDLTDQTAMMFKNCNSGRMNVVYRRADGNIGWIDPS